MGFGSRKEKDKNKHTSSNSLGFVYMSAESKYVTKIRVSILPSRKNKLACERWLFFCTINFYGIRFANKVCTRKNSYLPLKRLLKCVKYYILSMLSCFKSKTLMLAMFFKSFHFFIFWISQNFHIIWEFSI